MKIKAALKAVLRPAWHRIRPLIVRVFVTRSEFEALQAGWHQHIPALINASSSVGAISREHARYKREQEKALADLRTDIGRLRSEIHLGAAVAPRIIATDKVERARATGAKLAIGRGHLPLDTHVNIDTRELPGVDVVARPDALPFGRGEASEIVTQHVFEHFTQSEFDGVLLPYWIGLLKLGGTLRAIAPSAKAETLAASLRAAGLEDVRVASEDGREIEVAGRVPAK